MFFNGLLASELSEMAQSVLDACSFEQLQSQILQVHGELKLRFMLPNDLKKIAGVVKYIQSRVSDFRLFKRNETVLIGVAIQEMTSNAIIHGNLGVSSSLRDSEDGSYEKLIAERQLTSPYEDRRVEIQVTMDGDHAVFEISDEGDGFDVNSLPDPCDPENIGRVHGRGVFMTRSFMDDVSYNDVGNLVRMEKRAINDNVP